MAFNFSVGVAGPLCFDIDSGVDFEIAMVWINCLWYRGSVGKEEVLRKDCQCFMLFVLFYYLSCLFVYKKQSG